MQIVIRKVPLSSLNPAPYNPRKIDPKQLELLEKSIKEDGYVEPMVWNESTGNLVAGHQRLKVLQKLGVETIEVSVVNLSEEKEKVLNLRLNKQAGEWDFVQLADLLQELDTGSLSMDLTGFSEEELEDIMTFVGGEFKRPDFNTLIDEFENKKEGNDTKNQNWFYIEYYGSDEKFNALKKALGDNLKGQHEINADFFYKIMQGEK